MAIIIRRHWALALSSLLVLLLVASASLGMFRRRTSTDPILETHNASLTTMLTTAVSLENGIRPQVGHRAVNLDGSARVSSPLPMAFAGNPFEAAWNAGGGEINLGMGTYVVNDVDLVVPLSPVTQSRPPAVESK